MIIPKSSERSALAKCIGKRLKEAREVAGMSQNFAARRLGYVNSSKLAKIEGGTDTNSVPLWLILRASRLYEVSVDFIFGESNDWELSARACMERDVSKWVYDYWERARMRDMEAIKALQNRVRVFRESIADMLAASEELRASVQRFIELNPNFENEMRGGSRLIAAVQRVNDVSGGANHKLIRFREECQATRFQEQIESGTLDLKFK
ncbi:helix-turn-helix domain-containing protein [Nitrosomonas marina]|uniref:Helix-turn-helix domain-containing protein n=1 Tax=Nitrosomonas marina TaxID=917 RepID=A0A1H8J3E1_9PROT|nr:helix-turn-helix transcriptional regulator [Nitrosomonas marina]SEN75262.1 Helix-turn-helix domain-containing protein [Nitrosomonas marina]